MKTDTQNAEMDYSSMRKHSCTHAHTHRDTDTHAHSHTHSPQRQHSCADAGEIKVSLYFLYLTDNSRVTPHWAIYLLSQHVQYVDRANGGPAPALQPGKPVSFGCFRILIKLRWSRQLSRSLKSLKTTTVSWQALIPTQPCDEVMRWTQWPESWFYLVFWNIICVFIYFISQNPFSD